jgi:hypothetical protein
MNQGGGGVIHIQWNGSNISITLYAADPLIEK